mgnify:CR=1 FL=1
MPIILPGGIERQQALVFFAGLAHNLGNTAARVIPQMQLFPEGLTPLPLLELPIIDVPAGGAIPIRLEQLILDNDFILPTPASVKVNGLMRLLDSIDRNQELDRILTLAVVTVVRP